MADPVRVITIDGPGGVGKGTISQLVAKRLGWGLLDSGALYRLLALAAVMRNIALDDESSLAALAEQLPARFSTGLRGGPLRTLLDGTDVTDAIRSERCGNDASRVAALPGVRRALLERQRAFRKRPGLVADGRDMGTVVFPDAQLKIFLTASREERARRRHKQLKEKGMNVTLAPLLEEIDARDNRDRERAASPLRPAEDAVVIDTTSQRIGAVLDRVMTAVSQRSLCTD